jgi:phosphate starvation-inducible protein PhoH and related proteins
VARRKQSESQLHFRPKHPEQLQALDVISSNTITFLCGPAGTAKSFIATYYSLWRGQRIILSRPAITSGEKIGFLPGTMDQKLDPFLVPIFEAAEKITGSRDKQMLEILPLAYIRGRTIEDATLIVDEAQNLTPDEFVTIMTRIGENGKIIFCGDASQHDLHYSVIDQVADTYDGIECHGESIGKFRFSKNAIVRSPLIAKIIELSETASWRKGK